MGIPRNSKKGTIEGPYRFQEMDKVVIVCQTAAGFFSVKHLFDIIGHRSVQYLSSLMFAQMIIVVDFGEALQFVLPRREEGGEQPHDRLLYGLEIDEGIVLHLQPCWVFPEHVDFDCPRCFNSLIDIEALNMGAGVAPRHVYAKVHVSSKPCGSCCRPDDG